MFECNDTLKFSLCRLVLVSLIIIHWDWVRNRFCRCYSALYATTIIFKQWRFQNAWKRRIIYSVLLEKLHDEHFLMKRKHIRICILPLWYINLEINHEIYEMMLWWHYFSLHQHRTPLLHWYHTLCQQIWGTIRDFKNEYLLYYTSSMYHKKQIKIMFHHARFHSWLRRGGWTKPRSSSRQSTLLMPLFAFCCQVQCIR